MAKHGLKAGIKISHILNLQREETVEREKRRGEEEEEGEKEKKKRREEKRKGRAKRYGTMTMSMDFYDFWYGSLDFLYGFMFVGLWVVRNLTLD